MVLLPGLNAAQLRGDRVTGAKRPRAHSSPSIRSPYANVPSRDAQHFSTPPDDPSTPTSPHDEITPAATPTTGQAEAPPRRRRRVSFQDESQARGEARSAGTSAAQAGGAGAGGSRGAPSSPGAPAGEDGEWIHIVVVRAENLIIADANGLSDPFVDVALTGHGPKRVQSTKVVNRSLNPTWNQLLTFRRPAGAAAGPVPAELEVFDKDFMARDLLGVGTVQVGHVAPGQVQEVTVELEPRGDEVDLQYMGATCTNYGRLHLRLAAGPTRAPAPALRRRLLATPEPARHRSSSGEAPEGVSDSEEGVEASEAQKYIYVQPVRARHLTSMDWNGKADPYCVVSVNTSTFTRKTNALQATLNPEWHPGPFSFPFNQDTRSILLEVYNQQGYGFDESMGRIQVPIDRSRIQHPGQTHTEWYDIQPPPSVVSTNGISVAGMGSAMSGMFRGRSLQKVHTSAQHGLGQLYCTYSIGYLRNPPPSKELMPAFRMKMGKVKVEVLEVGPVAGVAADDVYLKVLFEGRCEQSRAAVRLHPGGTAINEAWEFDVTEVTSDIHIELWDEQVLSQDERFGQCVMPCKSLWGFAASDSPRWVTWLLIMPGGKKRVKRVGVHERPNKPIGCLKVAFTFRLDPDLRRPLVYVANKVLADPPEVPEGSVPELKAEAGRLVDALLSPLTSALAVLLYLQAWTNPAVNAAGIAAALLACFPFWRALPYLAPVLGAAALGVQGWLLRQIRLQVPVFVYEDEREAVMAGVKAMQAAKASAAAEAVKVAKKWQDKSMGEALTDTAADSTVKKSFEDTPKAEKGVMASIPGLSTWYAIQGIMKSTQASLAVWADKLERAGNTLAWKDEAVSLYSCLLLLAGGFAITLVWAPLLGLLRLLMWLSPLTWRHVAVLVAAFILSPLHKHTSGIVAVIDGILLGLPIPLTPCTWDSVPLLLAKYQRQLADLQDGGAESNRLAAAAEAQAQGAKAQKEREALEQEWMREEGGMQRLTEQRLREPVQLLTNLYARAPSNLEHLHRCRCVRHIMAAPLRGQWPALPQDLAPEDLAPTLLANSNAKDQWDHLRLVDGAPAPGVQAPTSPRRGAPSNEPDRHDDQSSPKQEPTLRATRSSFLERSTSFIRPTRTKSA